MLTIKDLTKRYDFQENEIASYLEQHRDELNVEGVHILLLDKTWLADDAAVAELDKVFLESDDSSVELKRLHIENATLKKQLDEEKKKSDGFLKDLNFAQEKFLTMQNSQKSINGSFVTTIKNRAEKAEKHLSMVEQRFKDDLDIKNARIAELDARVSEMQEKLVVSHQKTSDVIDELTKCNQEKLDLKKLADTKCAKAEFEILNVKHNEDQLYKNLHDKDIAIESLTQELNDLRKSYTEATNINATIHNNLNSVRQEFSNALAHLNADLLNTSFEDIPMILTAEKNDEMGQSVDDTPPQISVKEVKIAGMSTDEARSKIEQQRDEKLQQLADEQSTPKKRGFLARLGSFF